MIIPFGEWLPDQAPLGNPGCLTAQNVMPTISGYSSFPSQSVYSYSLTATCQGAFSALDASGNPHTYAGDATKLYEFVAPNFTDVSGGTYTIAADQYWHFDKFGEDIIATNFSDYPQAITMGGANFATLTTTLKARTLGVVRDFVVCGNTYDGVDGSVPFRLWWSAKGDATDFTPAAATFAGYADLVGTGGWIQRVIGGDNGVVFQENTISIITFNGVPGETFQIDVAEHGRGTKAPQSVIAIGRLIYYYGLDGFYVFDRDTRMSTPIGFGKVDKYFSETVDSTYIFKMVAAYDVDKKLIVWSFPSRGSTNGLADSLMVYNWAANKWSTVTSTNTEYLFQFISPGYTLDNLDYLGYTLDTLPFSLDSRVWTGGELILSAFNSAHQMTHFSSTAMDGFIETAEYEFIEDAKSTVNKVRIIAEAIGTEIAAVTRNDQFSTGTSGSILTATSNNTYRPRSTAKYHRFYIYFTGTVNNAKGLTDVEVIRRGRR